nr:zinc finger, CCHC-type [Tanacetum cinerariifolium]
MIFGFSEHSYRKRPKGHLSDLFRTSNQVVGCQTLQVVSRAQVRGFSGYLGSIKKRSLLFGFLVGAGWLQQVGIDNKGFLEFFDCLGSRQGVEDLREVSNDDTAMAQGRLEDKQPEEKTNTNRLVKEQEKEYLGGRSRRAEDTTTSTYLVSRSPSSTIEFKKPIDMLGFFSWLASIEQGTLEPVKVKNIGFNESGKYKKTFIGSSVCTGSMHVLHGFEFKVDQLGDHTFKVEPHENVDHVVGSQKVQTQDLMDYQLAHDRDQHLACELFGDFQVKGWIERRYGCSVRYVCAQQRIDDMVVSCGCKAKIWVSKGLPVKANGNLLGLEIIKD